MPAVKGGREKRVAIRIVGVFIMELVLGDMEYAHADISPSSCIAISRYIAPLATLFLYEKMCTEYAQLRANCACFSSILPLPEKLSCIINT